MKVYLIGVGMGNTDTLTTQAKNAINACKILIGAPRLIEPYSNIESYPMIMSGDIEDFIKKTDKFPVGVLLSGDVGFYSGAAALREKLKDHDVESIAGISSLSYFCAKTGSLWQDVNIVSVHGRECNFIGEIQSNNKTFLLTGGKVTAGDICRKLSTHGLGNLKVLIGERLSYPDECITVGTADSMTERSFKDLAVMLVENPEPVVRQFSAPGISDDEFLRGKVPMTKEEIRVLAVSKLHLKSNHILWDVGAGTGSVSIEGALAASKGHVYAVEKNPEAISLLEANKKKFGAYNLTVVAGSAPEVLQDIPKPDRVFLGGTGGQFIEIIKIALSKNPKVRFVVTAVTLETLSTALEFIKENNLAGVDIIQVSVTRTRKAGPNHMMMPLSPIWIISAEGKL